MRKNKNLIYIAGPTGIGKTNLSIEIAKKLNEENIRTSRGNAFYPSSVYSILKKKKIRDERLNKVFDKKISKFWFEYSSN